jgi:hypothetical protein
MQRSPERFQLGASRDSLAARLPKSEVQFAWMSEHGGSFSDSHLCGAADFSLLLRGMFQRAHTVAGAASARPGGPIVKGLRMQHVSPCACGRGVVHDGQLECDNCRFRAAARAARDRNCEVRTSEGGAPQGYMTPKQLRETK